MAVAVAADVPAAGRAVMVAGATGLVGQAVLAALSADKRYRAIHIVGRRAPGTRDARVHFHPVDFGQLPALPPVDDVYIALGTTIKVAGSQEAFRAVDHDAVVALARQARNAGAQRLAVVSAMGADSIKRRSSHGARAGRRRTRRAGSSFGRNAGLVRCRAQWPTRRSLRPVRS